MIARHWQLTRQDALDLCTAHGRKALSKRLLAWASDPGACPECYTTVADLFTMAIPTARSN